MTDFRTRSLDASTWADFARLVEKHNGVWGGCWCMAFHPEGVGPGRSVSASFLYNGTAAMFERQGFERTRRLGKNHWVVTKVVGGPPPAPPSAPGQVGEQTDGEAGRDRL
jgi:hypothetical protein